MALDALNDKTNFSIFVADNSLQKEISEDFRSALPAFTRPFTYEILDRSGLSYARNYALKKCNAPYIAYIDDDAFVDQGWVDEIMIAFKQWNAGVVGGKVLPIWEEKKPDWLEGGDLLGSLAILDWGDECRAITDYEWLIGASIAYETQVLQDIGGFDENLGRKGNILLCHEEMDVNLKIASRRKSVMYCGKATSKHVIQKERITQNWFCENAFWDGISRYIQTEKLDASCFSENDFTGLVGDCKQALLNRQDTNDFPRLMDEISNFKLLGHASFKKLALHTRNANNLGAIIQLLDRFVVMEDKYAALKDQMTQQETMFRDQLVQQGAVFQDKLDQQAVVFQNQQNQQTQQAAMFQDQLAQQTAVLQEQLTQQAARLTSLRNALRHPLAWLWKKLFRISPDKC